MVHGRMGPLHIKKNKRNPTYKRKKCLQLQLGGSPEWPSWLGAAWSLGGKTMTFRSVVVFCGRFREKAHGEVKGSQEIPSQSSD